MLSFTDLDQARRAAGVSYYRLCKMARVSRSTYWRALRGVHEMKGTVLHKLERALASPELHGPSQFRDDLSLIQAAVKGYVAVLATALGLDALQALAHLAEYSNGKSGDLIDWGEARRVRDLAFYCAVVALEMTAARVATAMGLSKQRMSQIVAGVEELRENDRVIDQLIEDTVSTMASNHNETESTKLLDSKSE